MNKKLISSKQGTVPQHVILAGPDIIMNANYMSPDLETTDTAILPGVFNKALLRLFTPIFQRVDNFLYSVERKVVEKITGMPL